MKQQVEKVFWRRIQPGDLFNSEKSLGTGPQGQVHIDIAPGVAIESFLGVSPLESGESYELEVITIGNPDVTSTLEVKQRPTKGTSARWGFARQNRSANDPLRPAAWTEPYGWPTFSTPPADTDDARTELNRIQGLFIYLVKTTDGLTYAGMTTGNRDHGSWPDIFDAMFAKQTASSGCIVPGLQSMEISPLATKIIEQFQTSKNVLLYGPPGTGKSHAVAEVYRALKYFNGDLNALVLDPYDSENPFSYTGVEMPLPAPTRTEWVTFHPDFGYENFIKGLKPTGEGLKLETKAGVLLDVALDVTHGPNEAGLVVVDEINRGNVPRILGDFITFMDTDYRDGGVNPIESDLPKALGGSGDHGVQVSFVEDPIVCDKWRFPDEVYLLATMNSVDKSVAPIDSAIGRRFVRLDAFADYDFLAKQLDVDLEEISALFSSGEESERSTLGLDNGEEFAEDWQDPEESVVTEDEGADIGLVEDSPGAAVSSSWTPQLAAISLLIYLNTEIEKYVDIDATLGHVYFLSIQSWIDLADVWDTRIFPQLKDRFSGRPDILETLLRVNDSGMPNDYALRPSRKPWVRDSDHRLTNLPETLLPKTFRLLIHGK